MRRRVTTAAVLLLACAAVALAADVPVTRLPRPAFPPAQASVTPTGSQRLAIVASRPSSPAWSPTIGTPAPWAPRTLAGLGLLYAFRQPGTMFLVYGHDGTTARVLAAANAKTHRLRYAFDFATFARSPRIAPGEAGFVTEQVLWAREADGVLYVATAHQTYASSSGGLNAYVAAVDIRTRKTLWRTPALVANARTFVLAGDALVTGYGFTREPDYLYLLDRESGRIRDRLLLNSAPQTISRHGNRLTVRTYDHVVTAELRAP